MMKNQMAGLMQAAQKMKETADRVQAELASTEVEGQSGAGMQCLRVNDDDRPEAR